MEVEDWKYQFVKLIAEFERPFELLEAWGIDLKLLVGKEGYDDLEQAIGISPKLPALVWNLTPLI